MRTVRARCAECGRGGRSARVPSAETVVRSVRHRVCNSAQVQLVYRSRLLPISSCESVCVRTALREASTCAHRKGAAVPLHMTGRTARTMHRLHCARPCHSFSSHAGDPAAWPPTPRQGELRRTQRSNGRRCGGRARVRGAQRLIVNGCANQVASSPSFPLLPSLCLPTRAPRKGHTEPLRRAAEKAPQQTLQT